LKIALDAYGTDSGPEAVMEGARIAAADGIVVRVFGPASLEGSDGVEVVHTGGWIANDADPGRRALHPGASVVMAAADVAEGSPPPWSAPSTGATMTAALFALKRLRGVHRPALAAQVPCREPIRVAPLRVRGGRHDALPRRRGEHRGPPQHLIQFAYLGSAFSQAVLGVERPRVALLSVGEEQKKGNPDVVRPTPHSPERTRSTSSATSRVATADRRGGCDRHGRLPGNVTLKTLEGTAKAVAGAVRDAARSGRRCRRRAAAATGAGGLRRGLDPNAVGGAVLPGLRRVAVVAHGSTPEGIANAVRLADHAVRERAVERTAESLRNSGATREGLRDTPVVTGGE
jgi:glycerol-3-phosphate acyltransferase PlsX